MNLELSTVLLNQHCQSQKKLRKKVSVSCIAGMSLQTLTISSSVFVGRMRKTIRIGPRSAGYAMSALAVQMWVLDVTNLSSTIPGLSRSAVNGVVIAGRGASTGLIRLAGRGDSVWARVETRVSPWFGLLGGDLERRLRKLLVRDSWLGTHDDR